MNIFALDECPATAARYHCLKHTVKMPVEYAQILSTASHINGMPQGYKPTHQKHPSTRWASESLENWLWLRELALNLGSHFHWVYGKHHKSISVIKELSVPPIPSNGLTPVYLAMPDALKGQKWESHVDAYRTYYRSYKAEIAKFADDIVPPWWDDRKYLFEKEKE